MTRSSSVASIFPRVRDLLPAGVSRPSRAAVKDDAFFYFSFSLFPIFPSQWFHVKRILSIIAYLAVGDSFGKLFKVLVELSLCPLGPWSGRLARA